MPCLALDKWQPMVIKVVVFSCQPEDQWKKKGLWTSEELNPRSGLTGILPATEPFAPSYRQRRKPDVYIPSNN